MNTNNRNPERVPPSDIPAEVVTLGSMVLDDAARATVLATLQAADFFRPAHATIYAALAELHAAGEPVDLVTLPAKLAERGGLDNVGGREYLAELVNGTPCAANAEHYAGIVRAHAEKRRLHSAAVQIAEAALDPKAEPAELLADAERALSAAVKSKTDKQTAAPVLVCLADVEPEEVRWLWPTRIALGKLTMIAGDPGLGKSFLTLDMAARVSRGDGWPDFPDATGEPGGVVLLSAEDDLADTIRPRLDAAGADVRRINAFTTIQTGTNAKGEPVFRPFTLEDVALLQAAIAATADCRLVVVDPISAYCGKTDSHKNADVRALLGPLIALAASAKVAVVAVNHLRKGDGPAMYRSMGSVAFNAAGRAVYAVAKDRDDPTGIRRLVVPVKNNCGDDRTGLAYRLIAPYGGQPVVAWEPQPVSVSADEALAPAEQERQRGPDPQERNEAADWLREALKAGPRAAAELRAEAKADGITEGTLKRAKERLGVKSGKGGMDGGWTWRLPQHAHESQGAARTQETCAPSGEPAPLRENARDSEDEPGEAAPEEDEEAQVVERPAAAETERPRLDPDRPGPVDLLDAEQLATYKAVRVSRPDGMSETEKHRCAWRAGVRNKKK